MNIRTRIYISYTIFYKNPALLGRASSSALDSFVLVDVVIVSLSIVLGRNNASTSSPIKYKAVVAPAFALNFC